MPSSRELGGVARIHHPSSDLPPYVRIKPSKAFLASRVGSKIDVAVAHEGETRHGRKALPLKELIEPHQGFSRPVESQVYVYARESYHQSSGGMYHAAPAPHIVLEQTPREMRPFYSSRRSVFTSHVYPGVSKYDHPQLYTDPRETCLARSFDEVRSQSEMCCPTPHQAQPETAHGSALIRAHPLPLWHPTPVKPSGLSRSYQEAGPCSSSSEKMVPRVPSRPEAHLALPSSSHHHPIPSSPHHHPIPSSPHHHRIPSSPVKSPIPPHAPSPALVLPQPQPSPCCATTPQPQSSPCCATTSTSSYTSYTEGYEPGHVKSYATWYRPGGPSHHFVETSPSHPHTLSPPKSAAYPPAVFSYAYPKPSHSSSAIPHHIPHRPGGRHMLPTQSAGGPPAYYRPTPATPLSSAPSTQLMRALSHLPDRVFPSQQWKRVSQEDGSAVNFRKGSGRLRKGSYANEASSIVAQGIPDHFFVVLDPSQEEAMSQEGLDKLRQSFPHKVWSGDIGWQPTGERGAAKLLALCLSFPEGESLRLLLNVLAQNKLKSQDTLPWGRLVDEAWIVLNDLWLVCIKTKEGYTKKRLLANITGSLVSLELKHQKRVRPHLGLTDAIYAVEVYTVQPLGTPVITEETNNAGDMLTAQPGLPVYKRSITLGSCRQRKRKAEHVGTEAPKYKKVRSPKDGNNWPSGANSGADSEPSSPVPESDSPSPPPSHSSKLASFRTTSPDSQGVQVVEGDIEPLGRKISFDRAVMYPSLSSAGKASLGLDRNGSSSPASNTSEPLRRSLSNTSEPLRRSLMSKLRTSPTSLTLRPPMGIAALESRQGPANKPLLREAEAEA